MKPDVKCSLKLWNREFWLSADLGLEQLDVLPDSGVSVAIEQSLTSEASDSSQTLAGDNADPTIAEAVQSSAVELVVVDSSLPDYQSLIDQLTSGNSSQSNYEIHLLDPASDGISQISQLLEDRSAISAVHILSHGASGQLNLGNTLLTPDDLQQYNDQLDSWGEALTERRGYPALRLQRGWRGDRS